MQDLRRNHTMARNDVKKLEVFVKWFRSATPFIHEFGGRTIVIAFGGEIGRAHV